EEAWYEETQALTFSHQGASVILQLPVLPVGVPKVLRIKYSGTPPIDASGWGGVYNQSGYTFNLGVGFAADPHSYGRAWFPCFDNFVERSTFDVTLTAPAAKPGYANGRLLSESVQNGQSIRRWKLEESIPAYLACFAAGPYTSWKRSYAGEQGPVPVEIAAVPADTNKVRGTFKNLPAALACYEHWFGPYRWNKIGYSLVPFNSGAMEHATNISIMRSAIDGSLGFETLWAHELSHHWWGDLATCSTAEDMWLNEGWASYSEHLFTEWVYGKQKYLDAVRDNHLNILQNAHLKEGGYRAVSGLPHELTYGDHVYKKGATVAHNLRGYLGDSLFRVGLRTAFDQTRFTDWSSAGLRERLSAATGYDLTDFFDNWVFAGGYPDYLIDSVKWIFSPVDAATVARVYVKQKLRGAPKFHQKVPLEFTFVTYFGNRIYRSATVSGENSVVEFMFPALGPYYRWVFVNTNLRLAQARADQERVIKVTGTQTFAQARMNVTVQALPDSAFLRLEHHYAMPDTGAAANPDGHLLSNRFWVVDGYLPDGFQARATVFYDGRGQGDQLDAELFDLSSPNEDSVLLLYRPGAGHAWQEYPTYVKNKLTPNDAY
ncbi:MAG TPA: M1 family metallopeptidase, partial [Saprospiraceae bacterium]|nr:M1 family metallopeptidase [Saprospiraceae bacterium]